MPASPMTFARRPQGVLSRIVPDRRRHKRISVTLLGRFMREKVFAPGRTLTWNELTRFATGSPLNAEAFAKDFQRK